MEHLVAEVLGKRRLPGQLALGVEVGPTEHVGHRFLVAAAEPPQQVEDPRIVGAVIETQIAFADRKVTMSLGTAPGRDDLRPSWGSRWLTGRSHDAG